MPGIPAADQGQGGERGEVRAASAEGGWPSIRFTDDADLNGQALEWCDVVANARVHGTTNRVPWEMLDEERPHLGKVPDRAALAPYLRADRKVSRDGFVSWEGSHYGVHWKWVETTVQVGERQGTVEIWAGDERIAVGEVERRSLDIYELVAGGAA